MQKYTQNFTKVYQGCSGSGLLPSPGLRSWRMSKRPMGHMVPSVDSRRGRDPAGCVRERGGGEHSQILRIIP